MLITICCVFGAEAAASVLEPDGPVPPGTAACIVFLDPVDPAAEADLVGPCGGAAIGSGTSSIQALPPCHPLPAVARFSALSGSAA